MNVLHYGDVISLIYEDEKFHLSIRGLQNTIRCGAASTYDCKNYKESLFVVMKGGTYSAMKRYNEFMEARLQKVSATSESVYASRRSSAKYGKVLAMMLANKGTDNSSQEMKKLKLKMEREQQQNETEAQRVSLVKFSHF